jgi:UDP-N-acetyl-D-glucosamine dehydrogenase
MPEYVVSRVAEALNEHRKALKGSRILVAGVAYKPDVSDVRESPALDVIDGLRRLGADVAYVDPHVPELEEGGHAMKSVAPDAGFGGYDAIVIVTHHRSIDYDRMVREADLIVDTRDALRAVKTGREKIVKL